jgi:hypothetical protein
MIERHRTYTLKELKEILTEEEYKSLFSKKFSKISPKPKITKFEDFDDETKNIYLEIKKHLKKSNRSQKFSVWAAGSRINGNWKTKEESEQNNLKISDYDFITDAKNVKNLDTLQEKLNVKIDRLIAADNKILID